MEELAVREVPATFFLVGERLAGNEGLVREMAVQGHQIGVHTWDHVMLDEEVSVQEFRTQMLRVRQGVKDILGEGDYWLRPPYGIMAPELQKLEEGPLIIWSVDPEDWKDRNRERIVSYVLERVRDGDIILMHDMFASSVDAALEIVDELQNRGYCFVTVEQLMTMRGVEPVGGRRYNRVSS
jgi:peptidoglycan/xylan/chitin deacetylase (PgdA/CDA1 family)